MAGFEDLLPAEIAGSRRQATSPMRTPRSGSGSPGPSGSLTNAAPAAAQPPPLPAAAAAAAAAAATNMSVPSVDGVPESVVEAWFQQADADGDGRVADSEARDFFLTSGLAAADLSKIWKLVKSPEVIAREGKGLARHRFAQVLRLIALAQSGEHEFNQENATAALHSNTWLTLHGAPLPPPRIGGQADVAAAAAGSSPFGGMGGGAAGAAAATPIAAAEHSRQQQIETSQVVASAAAADAQAAADVAAATSFFGPDHQLGAPAVYNDDEDDMFGLRALRERAAAHGAAISSGAAAAAAADGEVGSLQPSDTLARRLSRSVALSSRTIGNDGSNRAHTNPLEAPVAFEARLPPLQPKVSAKLTLLAAGNGSLFAGPSTGGGLLQWGRPEGNMRRPLDVEGQSAQQGKLTRLMSDLMYTYAAEAPVGTEDSDAAPAIEVPTSDKGRTAACLLVDEPAELLWVADKEGWVYAYDIGGEPSMSLRADHRVHQFQAYRVGHVTTMCRTPQGELWTGSSRGNIRVWELGEPALVGEAPEPPRCRELRKSYGERAHSGQVLFLACPADGQLVWSASAKGVLLWDAASGAFLGVLQRAVGRPPPQATASEIQAINSSDSAALKFKVDSSKGLETDPITGYVVARPSSSEWPRIAADQEAWAGQSDNNINELMERVSIGGSRVVQGAGKAVKLLGKLARGLGGGGSAPVPELSKPGGRQAGSTSFAIASPTQGAEEDWVGPQAAAAFDTSAGGIVGLVSLPSGGMWVLHKCGTVDRYTSAGRRLGCDECGASVTAAACVGQRVWVGFADGMISVRDQEGSSLKVFQAHHAGILSIAQAGTRTYTLAADGNIKGWSSATPHPADLDALVSWDEQACQTFRRESLRVLCVTWNVGESKPDPGSPFFRWVHETAFNTQLAVVGLQEIEMGSSSVALAAAKDVFNTKMQEKGNTNAKFWGAGVLSALGGERHWHQVGLRQLSGMLILVYARNHLKDDIGEVTTASVACGVLGVGGNKGAVAVEFTVHRRKIAVVCSHFTAHQGAVEARNANYATICRQLTFSRRAWFADEEAAQQQLGSAAKPKAASSLYALTVDDAADAESDDESSVGASSLEPAAPAMVATLEELVQGEGMRGAHMLVWLGDFNYRIDGGYEAVKERAIRNELGPLLELDQCRREMMAGRVFRGLREGALTFRPTYKFDKASANPFGYDTSEKRRIPAWCDRVFFRGSTPFATPEAEEGESLGTTNAEDEVVVTALEYNCWADVTDSDHKPVYAMLEANLPITDQAKKRIVCSQLLKECATAALQGVEETACSLAPDLVKLHPSAMPRQMVLLRNEGPQPLLFAVSHEGSAAAATLGDRHGTDSESIAAASAQRLLEVRPVRGVLQPGQDQALQVHLAEDEWALRGAALPPEMSCRVSVGNQYSAGGESLAPGSTQLSFTAACLTKL